jgi:putative ABC transport system permease protein
MGLMALTNVRQRRQEIAILGAIGLRSRQVLGVFLGKAVVTGLIGGLIGLSAGVLISVSVNGASVMPEISTILLALGLALGVAMLGSWLPAMMASRQDAATVLQQD